MQGELELRDDAEVATAALERPQQVGVLARAGAGAHDAPIRGDDLGRHEVVDAEAVTAAQPADAAAQGEAGDAGIRDQASGHRERERLRLAIDVAPERSALDPRTPPFRVDSHAAHRREVDHHAAIADRMPGDVVAAAADRRREALRAGEGNRGAYVRRARAARDHRRAAVDHGVPDRTGDVVVVVSRDERIAAQRSAQGLEGGLRDAGGGGIGHFLRAAHGASPLHRR